jgi:hypothetical protein
VVNLKSLAILSTLISPTLRPNAQFRLCRFCPTYQELCVQSTSRSLAFRVCREWPTHGLGVADSIGAEERSR